MNNTNPSEENIKIGRLLQEARESRHVLQSEMTDATDLTKNHISAVERGVSKASVKMLLGYCKKLDMTPNEILHMGNDDKILPELKRVLNASSKEEQKRILEMIKLMRNT